MNFLNFSNYTKDLHMSKCRTRVPLNVAPLIKPRSGVTSASKKTMLLPSLPSPARAEDAQSVSLCFHVSPNSLLSALFIHAWGKPLLKGAGQQTAFLGEGTTARVDLTDVWLSGKEGLWDEEQGVGDRTHGPPGPIVGLNGELESDKATLRAPG